MHLVMLWLCVSSSYQWVDRLSHLIGRFRFLAAAMAAGTRSNMMVNMVNMMVYMVNMMVNMGNMMDNMGNMMINMVNMMVLYNGRHSTLLNTTS